jgi:choline dehydrogenase-like flavoprotein
LLQWQRFRTGPNAHVGCSISLGFFKCKELEDSKEFADLPELEWRRLLVPSVPLYEVIINVTSLNYFLKPKNLAITTVILNMLNAQTNGNLRLQSADPMQPLRFQMDFLNHPYDERAAIERTREVLRVIRSPEFQKDNVADVHLPESDSEQDILQFWRDSSTTTWHMGCTCRIGKREKEDKAVVDTEFRSFGVKALRVADMSIMPFLPSTHTQPCAYQVGMIITEKWINEYHL